MVTSPRFSPPGRTAHAEEENAERRRPDSSVMGTLAGAPSATAAAEKAVIGSRVSLKTCAATPARRPPSRTAILLLLDFHALSSFLPLCAHEQHSW